MAEKITITKLYRSDKSKDGKPFVTKDGRPYSKISIKTREHGEVWLSGFESHWNANWREGQEVELETETVIGKDGKEYMNYKKPDPLATLVGELASLTKRVEALEQAKKIPADMPF